MDKQERTIENIRKAQAGQGVQLRFTMQGAAKPKMLLLGCVDARLNPRDDIGIPDGAAIIRRTISAVVPPYDPNDPSSQQFEKVLSETLAAGIKDIAVMGHTYCGGLDGCLCDNHATLPYVREHLKPLKAIRDQVCAEFSDKNEQFVAMEDRSVAQIVANIKSYPAVLKALAEDTITLHGWVIHTGTRRIREMDMEHPKKPFAEMRTLEGAPHKDNVIDMVRYKQAEVVRENRHAPQHLPDMIMLGDMDAEINPANDLNIPYGKAIIYRDSLSNQSEITLGKKAALQFATQAKNVKDIVVLGHYDSRKGEGDIVNAQALLRERFNRIKNDALVIDAMKKGVQLHGWLFDNAMHPPRILEMDAQQVFKPMVSSECKTPVLR